MARLYGGAALVILNTLELKPRPAEQVDTPGAGFNVRGHVGKGACQGQRR